jgi:2-methylcitrate dehydratase
MRTVAQKIGAYVAGLRYEHLGEEVLDYAKRILLDSLACAYGGADSEPARLTRETAGELGGANHATIWADGTRSSVPLAALANGVAIRYQDYNDVYFGPAWTAHPSDNIATLFAVAEWKRSSGAQLLLAMIAAYEVQMRFSDLPVERNLWHSGWHHTAACSYAAAAGVSKLLELDAERTTHAITLAGARSNTFAEIRHGDIPMDKALSAPIVASQSVVYALLAQRGFTGCATLLEGSYGFRTAVAGGVDVTPLVPETGDFRMLKVGLKPYPVEGMTPAMVQAALELREEHRIDPGEVKAVRILAHEEAVTKPSWDNSKLAPTTKETADHSFHYCVAVALVAGTVTSEQFSDDWLRNPMVATLMAKTRLEATPELTALFEQGARPAAVEISTARGTFYREVLYPRGDPRSPMTWQHVERKLRGQAERRIGAAAVQRIVERTGRMEHETGLRAFADMLAGKNR